MGIWTRKAIAQAAAEIDDGTPKLRRVLTARHLTLLGIGSTIGAGIFVITGHAAATYAGPGVVVSFMVAGLGCFFAGLCYAEFASMIPVAGSAYTYTYATMGRFLAWFIGWNLVLEYLAAASTVAVGWAGYLVQLLSQLGITIPQALSSAPLAMTSLTDISFTGAVLNLPDPRSKVFSKMLPVLTKQLKALAAGGRTKLVVDMDNVPESNADVVKSVVGIVSEAVDAGMKTAIAASSASVVESLKQIAETQNRLFPSRDAAREGLK